MPYLCFAAATLSLLTSSPVSGPKDVRLVKEWGGYESRYPLYIRGNKTPVFVDTNSDTVNGPSLISHTTRKGVLYATLESTSSGAITVSSDIAFIQDGPRFINKGGYKTKAHRGESILLVPVSGGPWIEAKPSFLYKGGQLADLGVTQEAGLGKGDSVVGWYYSKKDGSPYTGPDDLIGIGIYKQYFVYSGGSRKMKGRRRLQ